MKIVNPKSLAATIDAVSEAFFYKRTLTKAQRQEAAKWIAARQGEPGSYCGMPAPTQQDFAEGIRLFTGEKFHTRAGSAHVLGEEACRALVLLRVSEPAVRQALVRSTEGMAERLKASKARELGAGRKWLGRYCCGKCSVALWRHLTAGGVEDVGRESWLAAGMKGLKMQRDGTGKWRSFPFYYTLLALSEIDLPAAISEMQYAAPLCERYLKHATRDDKFAERRRVLAKHVLEKC